MKRMIAIFALVASGSLWAASNRELTLDVPMDGASVISLDVGVGELNVRPSDDGDVHARVRLEKSGSWFWPFGKSSAQIDQAKLKARRDDDTLVLGVKTGHRHRKFKERWDLYVPDNAQISIDMGVGAVEIRDVEAPMDVELGVGDVDIRCKRAWIGTINGEVVVGDVSIHGADQTETERHIVGGTSSGKGEGKLDITVEVGVGDATVRLDR